MLGPVVWQIPAGNDRRQWYFVVGSGGPDGFRCDQIAFEDEDLATKIRAAIQLRMWQLEKPIVVHDFEDELEMAKWCENIWPSVKTTDIRRSIEAERKTPSEAR